MQPGATVIVRWREREPSGVKPPQVHSGSFALHRRKWARRARGKLLGRRLLQACLSTFEHIFVGPCPRSIGTFHREQQHVHGLRLPVVRVSTLRSFAQSDADDSDTAVLFLNLRNNVLVLRRTKDAF